MASASETTIPRFTAAQRRALEWLPADGAWREKPGRMSPAVDSLHLYYRDLIEIDWRWRGRRARLTPIGISVREALANA